MKRMLISLALILAGGSAMPVLGDAIGEAANPPGPMEYLEVTDSVDLSAVTREKAQLIQMIAAGLLRAGKQEQISSLLLRQENQLEQVLQREARSEAERLRMEREAARSSEQEAQAEREGAS